METIKYQKSCSLLKDFVFFFLIQNLFLDISLGLRHLEHKYKQLPPALSHCAHHWIDRYLLLMMIFIFSDRLMKRSQIQAEQQDHTAILKEMFSLSFRIQLSENYCCCNNACFSLITAQNTGRARSKIIHLRFHHKENKPFPHCHLY